MRTKIGFTYHVVNIKLCQFVNENCLLGTFTYHVVNIKPRKESVLQPALKNLHIT